MTKSEFVDHVAEQGRLGTRRRSALSSMPPSTYRGDAEPWWRGRFSGFGKFHVAERGARQGVNPRPARRSRSRRPRSRASPRAPRSRRPSRADSDSPHTDARSAGTPFGDRLAASSPRVESQIVLGLDPDPARLWPAALEAATRWRRARRARRGGGGRPLHGRDRRRRRRPSSRSSRSSPASSASARPGCAALDRGRRRTRAAGAARPRRCQARRHRRERAAPTPRRFSDRPRRRSATSTASAPTRITVNPYMGARHAASRSRRLRGRAGAGVFVLVRTSNPGRRRRRGPRLRGGGTVWEHVAAIVDDAGPARPGVGHSPMSARSSAPRAPSTSRGCAS